MTKMEKGKKCTRFVFLLTVLSIHCALGLVKNHVLSTCLGPPTPVSWRLCIRGMPSALQNHRVPALQGGGASHLGAHADWGGGAGGAVARLTATCTLRFVLKSYEQTDRTLCALCVKGSPWGFHWVSPLLRSLPTLSSCSVWGLSLVGEETCVEQDSLVLNWFLRVLGVWRMETVLLAQLRWRNLP